MLSSVRENIGLKLFSLVLSIGIWFYAAAERNPVSTKKVMAEVKLVGNPPGDLIVKVRQDPLPIEVTGPRSELDAIMDGDVKAIVTLSDAKPDSHDIRVTDFKIPAIAPNVTAPPRQVVPAETTFKQKRRVTIEAVYNRDNPLGRVYGSVKLDPNWAWVVGSKTDVQRAAKLQVFIETRGGNVREDLPIVAVDRNDVQLDDVTTEPARTHVELNLVDAPTTRSLIVSSSVTGHPNPAYKITEVSVKPDQVIVAGKPETLLQLTNIQTAEVNVDGATADITRQVPLRLPDGVTTKDGARRVTVTVKIRDSLRAVP